MVPKENISCKCLSLIMLDSVVKAKKKYYPQTLLEECKYEPKTIQMENLIYDDLEKSSSDESDNEPDNGSNDETESDDVLILSFYFCLLQINFYIYLLLTLLTFFYHFHNNFLLYLVSHSCFFDNKFLQSSFIHDRKITHPFSHLD